MPILAMFNDNWRWVFEVEAGFDFLFGLFGQVAAFFVGVFEVVGGGGDLVIGDFIGEKK